MQIARRKGRKIAANGLQHMSVIPPPSLLLGADQLMDPACHRHTFDTLTDPMWTPRLNLALFLDATKHYVAQWLIR